MNDAGRGFRPGPRQRLRRVAMGLATLTGWRRRGYFIPYRYADRLPGPGQVAEYAAIAAVLEARRPAFRALIDDIDALETDLSRIDEGPAPEPRWRQGWFPRLDAAVAYALVRRRAPKRIIEVGSGHSTRFLARAVRDGGLQTRITAIDPAPRATLAGLAIEHLAHPAHDVPLDAFAGLDSGDVLFVDSSHILMPGSDVDFLFNRLWPRLPAGVLVHIHDVFLPDDYPAEWGWRGYNEQAAAALLIGSGAVEILFASHFAVTRMPGDIAASAVARLPMFAPAVESSLWLEKTADPVAGERAS